MVCSTDVSVLYNESRASDFVDGDVVRAIKCTSRFLQSQFSTTSGVDKADLAYSCLEDKVLPPSLPVTPRVS